MLSAEESLAHEVTSDIKQQKDDVAVQTRASSEHTPWLHYYTTMTKGHRFEVCFTTAGESPV